MLVKLWSRILCSLSVILAPACATSSTPAPAADSPQSASTGPAASRPIVLPASLEGQEPDVRAAVERACRHIDTFAAAHGWKHLVGDCFYDRVEVFETQPELTDRIIALHQLPPETKLPTGVVAALEKRVLMAVTETENQRLNPAYTQQDDAWARLLAHEIGHRLHVAVLDGDEDAMGPSWFFEGFAVVAAGQKLGAPLTYTSAEDALQGCHSNAPLAYRRYAAAVRYFMSRVPLATLVEQAGSTDFEQWLKTTAEAKPPQSSP